MPYEEDLPPQAGTFRKFVWQTVAGLQHLRAYWGRRFTGGAIALFADLVAEGARSATIARFPGHPEQAEDSLRQVGIDRDLYRFNGETNANWLARIVAAWDDYPQGGTPQQVLRVVNQWGTAGWPVTWDSNLVTLVENANPAIFDFTVTIPFGLIDPAWEIKTWGEVGRTWGESGLFWGIGDTDIPMLLYIVQKWKPARSRGYITVFYEAAASITFTV